jgi:hypothetical protein
MPYSLGEYVFILQHYFALKLFAESWNCWYALQCWRNTSQISTEIFKKTGTANWITVASARWETRQLKLWPYWFQSVRTLQQWDSPARIQYCHWFCGFVHEGITWCMLPLKWSHNQSKPAVECWEPTRAQNYLQSLKSGMWCTVSWVWLVWTVFFEETINVEYYQNFLIHFISLLGKLKVIAGFSIMGQMPTLWTQQALCCKRALVTTLLSMVLSHPNLQTS